MLLTILIFLPLIGAAGMMLAPEKTIKQYAMLAAILSFLLSVGLLVKFQSTSYGFQLLESRSWIPQLGISYKLGVDGISIWLVLLTTFLSIVAVACSLKIDKRPRAFMASILALESAMLGSFLSLDLVLFFIFFEMTLIPMWLLINVGGGEKRAQAANKFLIYTFAGSIFMLIGIIGLGYLQFQTTGQLSFDIVQIQAKVADGTFWAGALQSEPFIFWAFAIALLIKSPSFPFHTWIPDTYAESPIAGPILSSVMVKMGTYGFLRFCLPLFPDTIAHQVPILVAFAVIGIVYGAAVAAVQPDMRRLLAYSSLSHMGFVLLGIFSLTKVGLLGGAYQQLNHAITASIMFVLVGYLYQRRGSTMLKDFGGLKAQMPLFASLFLIAMLSSAGLPGTNGFVGEFLAVLGAFQASFGDHLFAVGLVVVAVFGVVLAAVYMLYMFQRIFYGEVTDERNRSLPDLKRPEYLLAGALVIFIIWGGVYPTTFTKPMETSLNATLEMTVNPAGQRPTWSDADLTVVQRSDRSAKQVRVALGSRRKP